MIFSFDKFGTWWRNRHSRREDRQWERRRTRKVFAWLPVRLASDLSNEHYFCRWNTQTWRWAWLRPVWKFSVKKSIRIDSRVYVWATIYKINRSEDVK